MKHLKHLFTALLLMCVAVATAHDFEVDGIYYNITDATNKTVKVTYIGDVFYFYSNEYTGSVVIPESVTYNGKTYSVTSIGDDAFRECYGLTSVVISSSVTSIGDYAFSNCFSLTCVEIPNSVTSIGVGAFSVCSGLTGVEIPNSVTSIGDYAFNFCRSLTRIVIGNSVTSFGEGAFGYCSGLTSVVIPSSVTSIGDRAFNYCSGLTSVEIPNSVTSIGVWAFLGCSGLTSVVIPNSVTSIGDYAFYGCSSVEGLYISSTIESIGDYAFAGCNNIFEIKIGSKKAVAASENVFSSDTYNNACLYVPEGRKFAYERTTPWNNFNIVEMDFTDIDDVKDENGEVGTIYDLNGRVVENPTNGIYIINGKKVLVR